MTKIKIGFESKFLNEVVFLTAVFGLVALRATGGRFGLVVTLLRLYNNLERVGCKCLKMFSVFVEMQRQTELLACRVLAVCIQGNNHEIKGFLLVFLTSVAFPTFKFIVYVSYVCYEIYIYIFILR